MTLTIVMLSPCFAQTDIILTSMIFIYRNKCLAGQITYSHNGTNLVIQVPLNPPSSFNYSFFMMIGVFQFDCKQYTCEIMDISNIKEQKNPIFSMQTGATHQSSLPDKSSIDCGYDSSSSSSPPPLLLRVLFWYFAIGKFIL